jgi:predicted nucleotidyltransferase
MNRSEILNRIKSGIAGKDAGAEIYLYGSRARGDYHVDSDWDILVIASRDKVTFDYESDLRDPIFDIELESGEIISVIIYSKSDWQKKQSISPLFLSVIKEGIKI